MEGFLIFLAITLVSFVFNKMKSSETDSAEKRKQMPPMSQGPSSNKKTTENSKSNLGDYMKKVALELEKQFEETNSKKDSNKNLPKMKPEKVEVIKADVETFVRGEAQELARQEARNQRSIQSSIERSREAKEKRQQQLNRPNQRSRMMEESIVPRSRKGMARAIVMSEILAPPISKRKR